MSWLFGGSKNKDKEKLSQEELDKKAADHARQQRLKKLGGSAPSQQN